MGRFHWLHAQERTYQLVGFNATMALCLHQRTSSYLNGFLNGNQLSILSSSKLRTFDLGLTPNLERLSLQDCADFEELHVPVACQNLKFLDIRKSRLTSLDLELIPNLERLNLEGCDKLLEINAPVGCLKKVSYVNLKGCLRFNDFKFYGRKEPPLHCSSANFLDLVGESSMGFCPLHPNNNLLKFRFCVIYKEYLSSSAVGHIEKLISFGLFTCTYPKHECSITEFPKDIGQLECLEELHLASKEIKHLPDSICMLKRLKSLDVSRCDLLEKLPEDLGNLECLEKLYARIKKIEYLPDSICMLKRLKSLDVSSDLLEKLPEDLGNLECLEKLYVGSQKMEYLPSSLCMLNRLKCLDVSDCSWLGKLPEDIGQLECLEELHLSSTKIIHLPDSICMLKHLKSLDVSRCDLLEKLPEDLGNLECLEKLYVGSKKMEYLPSSLCMLNRLKCLDVSYCSWLGKLPEDIGQLETLEILELSAAKIKHLPDSICMLKHLRSLILNNCALLEKLPEDLIRLVCSSVYKTTSRSWTVEVGPKRENQVGTSDNRFIEADYGYSEKNKCEDNGSTSITHQIENLL